VRQIRERMEGCPAAVHDETLTLPFEIRQRSRFRARLDSGLDVGVILPRGAVLRHDDRLRDDQGRIVVVRAAPEPVTTAHSADPTVLARACYHLGNRHVALQIAATWVRYQPDHVLDAMVQALGLTVRHEHTPFEPEAGAYFGTGHRPHRRSGD